MEKINTDELIKKLISGSYEEFCKNIVVFLEVVSIHFKTFYYLPRNVKYIFLIEIDLYYKVYNFRRNFISH